MRKEKISQDTKDQYTQALEGYLFDFCKAILGDETMSVNNLEQMDMGETVEMALRKIRGEAKIEVTMELQLSRYIKRDGRILLREGLADTDPDSWSFQWLERYGSKIDSDIGPDWRDTIEDI